jgi:hypothetical protein
VTSENSKYRSREDKDKYFFHVGKITEKDMGLLASGDRGRRAGSCKPAWATQTLKKTENGSR